MVLRQVILESFYQTFYHDQHPSPCCSSRRVKIIFSNVKIYILLHNLTKGSYVFTYLFKNTKKYQVENERT